MPVLRVLLGAFLVAFVQPALAQEFWDPVQCEATMIDHVARLEENVAAIKDLGERLAEAQRKGETERAAIFQHNLESQRVDGLQSMLKRIDTVEYIYCDKSKFDPSLIARVDAVRPFAEATETVVAAVEEEPKIMVTGITSTFVPYEMLEVGGCKGPFLDLAINLANAGGVYPRPVDVEKTQREYPTLDIRAKPLLNLTLLIDWGAGYGQVPLPLPWDAFEGGTFASGASMSVPYRLFVPNDETSVRLGGQVTGQFFFVVDGTSQTSVTYETEVPIPIWDLYTHSVGVVSGPNEDNKHIIEAVLVAEVVNLGGSPIPGGVEGSFSVRQPQDGPRLVTVTGSSGGSIPGGGRVVGKNTVAALIKGKLFVESLIYPLCPDGSHGTLSDGNTANNKRMLESTR